MSSKVEICNMALSHLGIGSEIANLDSDAGQEASACRRFYDLCRDKMFRDHEWPFATQSATLSLVEEDPTAEWAYSYRYPSDCAYFRRVLNVTVRNESRDNRIPFRIMRDASGKLIYTDEPTPECEYTVIVTDPSQYPPDFVLAMSYLLASLIAARITAGDPYKLGAAAMGMYELQKQNAQANAANEQSDEMPPDAEMIRERQ